MVTADSQAEKSSLILMVGWDGMAAVLSQEKIHLRLIAVRLIWPDMLRRTLSRLSLPVDAKCLLLTLSDLRIRSRCVLIHLVRAKVADTVISKAVNKTFGLKPAQIIKQLDLLRPIYGPTSAYGHFGRTTGLKSFTWEKNRQGARSCCGNIITTFCKRK